MKYLYIHNIIPIDPLDQKRCRYFHNFDSQRCGNEIPIPLQGHNVADVDILLAKPAQSITHSAQLAYQEPESVHAPTRID